MNATKHVAVAAALAGLFTLTNTHADESRLTMKPLQAVAFEVGSERIVGYYLNENDACTLRVTRAAEPNWDEPNALRGDDLRSGRRGRQGDALRLDGGQRVRVRMRGRCAAP